MPPTPLSMVQETDMNSSNIVMKEYDYLLLLSKRLSGEISTEESADLDEWLRQSSEHEQFASETQEIWKKAEGFGKTFAPDLQADFEKVQAKIRPLSQPALRVSFTRQYLRIAAAVVFLIAATWVFKQFAGTDQSTVILAASNQSIKSAALPDGSKVWLREGAQLSYEGKLDAAVRQVTLQGEAYFEVHHDPAHPFKVRLENGGAVEVLGTQFNVRQTKTQTDVLVRSGKVRFSPNAQTEGPVLTANQKAEYDYSAAKVQVSSLSSLNELSWQTGGLEFVNTPLQQVMADLEKFYNVKISLKNPAMASCPHSAPLTSQAIDQVLETIALTHQLKVQKLGERSFELSGGQCR